MTDWYKLLCFYLRKAPKGIQSATLGKCFSEGSFANAQGQKRSAAPWSMATDPTGPPKLSVWQAASNTSIYTWKKRQFQQK